MSSSIADPVLPLQDIITSYVYQQYADDENLVAFAESYNAISQTYLDFFTQTPFGVYTNPLVSGPLLDWIAEGIYGITRPVFSTLSSHFTGAALNAVPLNTIAINGSFKSQSGSAVTANDDFYKRTITWMTYVGDGRMCNVTNIRKRIARFLYGVNGTDISLSQAQNVSIAIQASPLEFEITIPAGTSSTYFQEAFNSGILSFPFQLAATVTIA